jgi:hypothetical protein
VFPFWVTPTIDIEPKNDGIGKMIPSFFIILF